MFNRNNPPPSMPFGARPGALQPRAPRPQQQQPPPQQGYNDGYDTQMAGGYPPEPQGYGGPRSPPTRVPVGRGPPSAQKSPVNTNITLQLRPVKSAGGNTYAFANLVAISPRDAEQLQAAPDQHGIFYVLVNQQYVLSAKITPNCNPGEIGLTDSQRSWVGISLGPSEQVLVSPYDAYGPGAMYLKSITLEIGFASRKSTDQPYDQEELAALFIKNFDSQILAPQQSLLMDHKNIPLRLTVRSVDLTDLSMEKPSDTLDKTSSDPRSRGFLFKQTTIDFFKDAKSDIKLKASATRPAANTIIAPDFKFEAMGIGGLDTEFSQIFRRAFASRIFPPGLVEKLGGQHVRGLLLYGPPGTGKTLIARKIGQMLNARPPKVINGPEVLNKFVGQSEENIRKMFADAEKEYKEKGDESGLHIIIFDELDAVCKQRGSGGGGGTGVGDSVVNQLLSKLDGVDQLNNILLIGMTNRKDMIDEALLRPGRLEVHIEIALPDEEGRLQILNIKTAEMQQNGMMSSDVDLKELAARTKNYSGAELLGLCNAARSYVYARHIKVGTMAALKDDIAEMKVTMADFENALEDVKPAFGVDDESLSRAFERGIIPYSPAIQEIMDEGRKYSSIVMGAGASTLTSVLLHGPRNSGTTALAARMAVDSEAPLVKLISPDKMTGFGDAQKVAYIERQFSDSYKSKSSVIVLDSVERLFSWVPIGPRFSMMVVDALLVLLNKQPPSGHRLLVFATSSIPETLGELGFSFSRELRVRNVETAREVQSILMKYGGLPDYEASSAMQMYGSNDVNVGVKRILSAIDRAKADANVPQSFARLLKELAGMPAAGTVAPPGGQLRVRGADFGGNDADRMIQY